MSNDAHNQPYYNIPHKELAGWLAQLKQARGKLEELQGDIAELQRLAYELRGEVRAVKRMSGKGDSGGQ